MGGLGCDNMTCVLVCLLHGQSYQALVEKCAGLTNQKGEELKRQVAEELNQDDEEEK